MSWTTEDDKLLAEMLERKQAYENTMRECVARAVDTHLTVYQVDEVVGDLIKNATVFRKVLEPFDKEFKS